MFGLIAMLSNPIARALTVAAAIALSIGAGYTAGYLHHAHVAQIEEAQRVTKQDTIQQAVTTTVTVVDTQAVDTLTKKLADARAKAASLQQLIAEAKNEKPAAIDCRIPERVRDTINAELTTGTE